MVAMQQAMGRDKGVVMDGRDIGTTVFPDAELKIFMTASVDVRAERRYKELAAKGENVTLEEVRRNVMERDRIDETRTESPLRQQLHDGGRTDGLGRHHSKRDIGIASTRSVRASGTLRSGRSLSRTISWRAFQSDLLLKASRNDRAQTPFL